MTTTCAWCGQQLPRIDSGQPILLGDLWFCSEDHAEQFWQRQSQKKSTEVSMMKCAWCQRELPLTNHGFTLEPFRVAYPMKDGAEIIKKDFCNEDHAFLYTNQEKMKEPPAPPPAMELLPFMSYRSEVPTHKFSFECPTCGYLGDFPDAKYCTRLHDAYGLDITALSTPSTPHLHRECRCGYAWLEETKQEQDKGTDDDELTEKARVSIQRRMDKQAKSTMPCARCGRLFVPNAKQFNPIGAHDLICSECSQMKQEAK